MTTEVLGHRLPRNKTESSLYLLATEVFQNFQVRSAWGALPSGFERSFLSEAIRFLNEALVPLCRESIFTEDFVADVRVTLVKWTGPNETEFTIEFGGIEGAVPLDFVHDEDSEEAGDGDPAPLTVQLGAETSADFHVEILTYDLRGRDLAEQVIAAPLGALDPDVAGSKRPGQRQQLETNYVKLLRKIIDDLYQACRDEPGLRARREFSNSSWELSESDPDGADPRPEQGLAATIEKANREAEKLLQSLNHRDFPTPLYRSYIMLLHPGKDDGSLLYYTTYNTSIPKGNRLFFARRSKGLLGALSLRAWESGDEDDLIQRLSNLASSVLTLADLSAVAGVDPAQTISAVVTRLCALYSQQSDFPSERIARSLDEILMKEIGRAQAQESDKELARVNAPRVFHQLAEDVFAAENGGWPHVRSLWTEMKELLERCPGAAGQPAEAVWQTLWTALYYAGFEYAAVDLVGKLAAEVKKDEGTDAAFFRSTFEIVFPDPEVMKPWLSACSIGDEDDPNRPSLYREEDARFLWEGPFGRDLRRACARWEEGRVTVPTREELARYLLTLNGTGSPDAWVSASDRQTPLLYQLSTVGSAGRIRAAYMPLLITRQDCETNFLMNQRRRTHPEYFVMGLLEKPHGIGGTPNPLLICPLISRGHVVGVQFVTFFGPNGGFVERNLRDIEAHSHSVASVLQEYRERVFKEGRRRESRDYWSEEERRDFLKKTAAAISAYLGCRLWAVRRKSFPGPEERRGARCEEALKNWGDHVDGRLEREREPVSRMRLSELLGAGGCRASWRVNVTRYRSGSLLTVKNSIQLEGNNHYDEVIVFECEQVVDVVEENLTRWSDLLFGTLNPKGTVPPKQVPDEVLATEVRALLLESSMGGQQWATDEVDGVVQEFIAKIHGLPTRREREEFGQSFVQGLKSARDEKKNVLTEARRLLKRS